MRLALLFPFFALSACTAAVGTASIVSVPKDARGQCDAMCKQLGMPLQSVVVMASNVGCVCSVNAEQSAGAAAGGMATIVLQEQQAQQQKH